MTITIITDSFSVSGELTEQELVELSARGVSTLINVRPDGEASEQKTDAQWRAICQAHGLRYFFIPVRPGDYSERDIEKYRQALNSTNESIHGFCRTGTRAVHLFALANKDKRTFEQLQQMLSGTHYDLNAINRHYT